MVKVAIAGGTGGLGRAIVDAFNAQSEHTIVILTREINTDLSAQLNAPLVEIDYANPASVQKTLDENQIHTVISTIGVTSQDHSDAQISLIRGSAASSSVKRFAPSEFGIPYTQKDAEIFFIAAFKLAAVAELEKTNLEYTLFSNGYFMDGFGVPKYKSYLPPLPMIRDIQNKTAGIPGSGDTPVIFTSTHDVGRFVVASVGLEKWNKHSPMIGDRKSWNEILAIAEKVTGTKFNVHHDSIDKLKTGQITELPGHKNFYPFFPKEALAGVFSIFGQWFEAGESDYKIASEESLNEKFPEIEPFGIHKMIKENWA